MNLQLLGNTAAIAVFCLFQLPGSEGGVVNASIAYNSDFGQDLSLSDKERGVLGQFRKLVESKLKHDFMKTDLYLVRWLRARDFNVHDAEEMLLKSLKWRKDNKIDTIHQENWKKFQKRYPFYIMKDKLGQPALYLNPGKWDLRRIAISNDADKFRRYVDKAIDECSNIVWDLQRQGKNITRGRVIVNLKGYNVVQHACLQCIPIILRGILTYENYYPGLAQSINIVNTPTSFEPLLQTIKEVISTGTKKALKIHGVNKAEFKPILLSYFSKENLPEELGGTLQLDDDYDYYQ